MTRPKRINGLTDEQRAAMCAKKVRYADELTAGAGALISLEKHQSGYLKLWVYHCPVCKGYHCTKKPVAGKKPYTLDEREAA